MSVSNCAWGLTAAWLLTTWFAITTNVPVHSSRRGSILFGAAGVHTLARIAVRNCEEAIRTCYGGENRPARRESDSGGGI